MRFIIAISFLISLWQGNWVDALSSVFIFILMMAPSLLKKRYKIYIPIELDVALVSFVFFNLYLGSFHNYYEQFAWFDGVSHFLSGILLGIVGFVLVYFLNERGSKALILSPGFVSLFAVTFSLAVSVVWEIYEYTIDLLLGFNMQENGLPDTMGDFIVNFVGAVIVAIIGYIWMKKHKILPFIFRKGR
jgi:hypothetical protein